VFPDEGQKRGTAKGEREIPPYDEGRLVKLARGTESKNGIRGFERGGT